MTTIATEQHAEIRASLVDLGVPIDEADDLAGDHPHTAELVPLRLVLDELDDDPRAARRLAPLVVRDDLGLRAVPAPLVKAIIEGRDRLTAERAAEARQRRLMRFNERWNRRRTLDVDQLQAQLEALVDDDEISEPLQAAFAQSLMDRIQRIKEGDPPPEIVGHGVAFGGVSDEELAEIMKAERRAQREARYGKAKP